MSSSKQVKEEDFPDLQEIVQMAKGVKRADIVKTAAGGETY